MYLKQNKYLCTDCKNETDKSLGLFEREDYPTFASVINTATTCATAIDGLLKMQKLIESPEYQGIICSKCKTEFLPDQERWFWERKEYVRAISRSKEMKKL